MEQCPNCGVDLDDTVAIVCPRCGASLSPSCQRRIAHPVLFKIFDLGVAAFGVLTVMTVLFSFVFFMNGRMKRQTYEGRPYYITNFKVLHVFYKEYMTGGGKSPVHTHPEAFASGIVEGKQEWMDLLPFLHPAPSSQFEVEHRVPAGTVIQVYLFPDPSGDRVVYDSGTPPAEQGEKAESGALRYGPLGAVGGVGIVLMLARLRAACRA